MTRDKIKEFRNECPVTFIMALAITAIVTMSILFYLFGVMAAPISWALIMLAGMIASLREIYKYSLKKRGIT